MLAGDNLVKLIGTFIYSFLSQQSFPIDDKLQHVSP